MELEYQISNNGTGLEKKKPCNEYLLIFLQQLLNNPTRKEATNDGNGGIRASLNKYRKIEICMRFGLVASGARFYCDGNLFLYKKRVKNRRTVLHFQTMRR